MLTIRVIPIVLTDGVSSLTTVKFVDRRPVGSIANAARVYGARDVDELVLLDIDARKQGRLIDLDLVRRFAGEIAAPLAIGGGVRGAADTEALLKAGADRVVVSIRSTGAGEIARQFGAQALVECVDYRGGGADLGMPTRAGEVLWHSMDRNGTMQGYGVDLVRMTQARVIVAGGCGKPEHAVEAVRAGAVAVAASSIFQFTETTPAMLRAAIGAAGFAVRS